MEERGELQRGGEIEARALSAWWRRNCRSCLQGKHEWLRYRRGPTRKLAPATVSHEDDWITFVIGGFNEFLESIQELAKERR